MRAILIVLLLTSCTQHTEQRQFTDQNARYIRQIMINCGMANPDNDSYQHCLRQHNATI